MGYAASNAKVEPLKEDDVSIYIVDQAGLLSFFFPDKSTIQCHGFKGVLWRGQLMGHLYCY